MPFLSQEKEFNLFIIGDIINTKTDAPHMEVFVEGDVEIPRGVLLRYHKNFVIYSKTDMDYAGAGKVVENFRDAMVLSGKPSCVDRIEPFLREFVETQSKMSFAVLKEPTLFESGLPVARATVEDVPELLRLLEGIEEFGETDEEAFMASMEDGGTRRYVLRVGNKIVSTAASTAETPELAMIIGVATHKSYRNRGFASAVISSLCSDLLREGKTVCLFYDNPAAGKIYNRLGFQEVGTWKMLRFKKRRS